MCHMSEGHGDVHPGEEQRGNHRGLPGSFPSLALKSQATSESRANRDGW